MTELPKRVYTHAYASVQFSADQLDPLMVTRVLQLPPDHTHRDSEPRLVRVRSGKIEHRAPYRGGMWLMTSKNLVQSPQLATHLDWLLRELEPKADAIRALLNNGISAEFSCFTFGSTATPPSLPRAIRHRASALGIEIAIDHHYGP